MMKKCSRCQVEKPHEEFYKHKGRNDGIDDSCVVCKKAARRTPHAKELARARAKIRWSRPDQQELNRKRSRDFRYSEKGQVYILKDYLRRNYNLTIQQYNKMFADQGGCCAICKKHETEFKKRLSIDHDHITGEVRELLCQFCNTSLGNFDDNEDRLMEAVNYLRKHKLKSKPEVV